MLAKRKDEEPSEINYQDQKSLIERQKKEEMPGLSENSADVPFSFWYKRNDNIFDRYKRL